MRTDKYSHSALGPLGSRRSDCLDHPSPQLDDLICIVFHDETEHKQLENHNLVVVREAPKHVCGSECRQPKTSLSDIVRDAVGALASGTRLLVRGRAELEVCSAWGRWRRGVWYFKGEALILLSFLLISLFPCREWSFDCQDRGT